jgi:hypothetical protein
VTARDTRDARNAGLSGRIKRHRVPFEGGRVCNYPNSVTLALVSTRIRTWLKFTSRIAIPINYDRRGRDEVHSEVEQMSLETALSILQVVGITGILLAAFQIRDRLDKLNQQLEKK